MGFDEEWLHPFWVIIRAIDNGYLEYMKEKHDEARDKPSPPPAK